MHAGPDAAAPAPDDDHFGAENLGQPVECMRNISSQLAELHAYAFLIGY
jgi:hypothetical protein